MRVKWCVDMHGISMTLDGSFGKLQLRTQLLGRFNAENALVVLACLLSLGRIARRGRGGARPSARRRRDAWR